jgi:large subunit ribosomal protein L14
MIQLLTKLNVADNSGATQAKVIKILRPKNKKYALIGDLVLVAIQKIYHTLKLEKDILLKLYLFDQIKKLLCFHINKFEIKVILS